VVATTRPAAGRVADMGQTVGRFQRLECPAAGVSLGRRWVGRRAAGLMNSHCAERTQNPHQWQDMRNTETHRLSQTRLQTVEPRIWFAPGACTVLPQNRDSLARMCLDRLAHRHQTHSCHQPLLEQPSVCRFCRYSFHSPSIPSTRYTVLRLTSYRRHTRLMDAPWRTSRRIWSFRSLRTSP
jgi:hypothetical protein